jgi:DNA (cytosine-5)-methyltransferase 1
MTGCAETSARVLAPTDEFPGTRLRAAEFFAGIGLARIALEPWMDVVWANDIDPAKHAMYQEHFGPDDTFLCRDVGQVKAEDLPTPIDLAWASFPCVDLSLAGNRAGLRGNESSVFWEFARVMDQLEGERPQVVCVENVNGLATSHGGEDLIAAIRELNRLGYSVDVLTLDARRFVPQSRPRLFLVGAVTPPDHDEATRTDGVLRPPWLQRPFDDPSLRTHRASLPAPPPLLESGLRAVVERLAPDDPLWWDAARTDAFIASLSPLQAQRAEQLRQADRVSYRTAYRRTRRGRPVWEIRPDDIAGCLRTARGGSSKQAVVELGRGALRVRWMMPREYARLMGASDYCLNGVARNQALFGFGDAVCVPVVGWLAEHYLVPLAVQSRAAGVLT